MPAPGWPGRGPTSSCSCTSPATARRSTSCTSPATSTSRSPGRGKDKINAAFAYGGAPLLVQTLQDLVGVPVDHVAIIDFEGFQRMTDAVGGVNVYVEEGSSGGGYTFTKGFQQMGGAEALAFVRERKTLSEGDISRGRRQQAFIKALMLKSLSRDVLATRCGWPSSSTPAPRTSRSTRRSPCHRCARRPCRCGRCGAGTSPSSPPRSPATARRPQGASIDLLDEQGMKELAGPCRRTRCRPTRTHHHALSGQLFFQSLSDAPAR